MKMQRDSRSQCNRKISVPDSLYGTSYIKEAPSCVDGASLMFLPVLKNFLNS